MCPHTVPVAMVSTGPQGKGKAMNLTKRELEVLRCIVDGRSNKQIATLLGIAVNTVAVHRANIMKAVGVHKAVDLVVYAIRNSLVPIPRGPQEALDCQTIEVLVGSNRQTILQKTPIPCTGRLSTA